MFSVLAAVAAAALLVVLFIMTRRDILNERKTKDRLQGIIRENKELLEMRKNIILTVSHDIRGPLGNIANCAELASTTSAKKKRDGYLSDITRSCAHALRLANRLLDVYKTFEPNEPLNETPFRLDAFLDGISDDFRRKANAKALMFEYECKGCDVTVKGDSDKLEQVVDNLLSNAVKFTNSGTVRFMAVYANGTLAVEISDTGIGMDEETLGRVFRPFERAAQDVNSEGFGLGLAITKGLTNALGGSLDVESELGKGSVFSLKLPLTVTDEEVAAVEIPTATSSVLPRCVLVVDDDCILLKVIEEMLGCNGVECTACRNAREAVEALGKNGYDLVLTDVQMPDTDGFGLLKLLRTADIGCSRTVPVAVMTARGDGDSDVYLPAGFCGCLHKPFSMRQLTVFLSSCVSSESHRPKFNFEGLLEHTGDRRHMLEVLLRQSENDKSDMEKALAVLDREALRAVTHRMLSSWSFLGAEGLIESFRKVLVAASVDDETVRNEAATLVYAIERLIGEVKALIENEQLTINKMSVEILIVEDNIVLGEVLSRWIGKVGVDADIAMHEPSARRKMERKDYSMVLTDVRLPKGDGLSLLEWSMAARHGVPFVVMTDYASVPDAVRAVKMGAEDYLPKPVHEERLTELLGNIIGNVGKAFGYERSLLRRRSPQALAAEIWQSALLVPTGRL